MILRYVGALAGAWFELGGWGDGCGRRGLAGLEEWEEEEGGGQEEEGAGRGGRRAQNAGPCQDGMYGVPRTHPSLQETERDGREGTNGMQWNGMEHKVGKVGHSRLVITGQGKSSCQRIKSRTEFDESF